MARSWRHPAVILILLAVAAIGVAVAFMTIGAQGRWSFVLPFRGTKLAALVLVAVAVATATVLFQTVTNNRILTPSIMGFDALYGLLQTGIVFALGARGLGLGDPRLAFVVETGSMVVFAVALYRVLLGGRLGGIHLILLVGVVIGALFRSLSALMARMIDPNDFVVLQDRFFANFNTIHAELLGWAAGAVALVLVAVWRMLPRLDVLLLGREAAIGLGVDHRATLGRVLALVAVLVSVSTALVGPVTFFGILVANLAYLAIRSHRHALVLPAACLLATIALVGGQLVLERVFALNAALSIVIEFAGGLVFLFLLTRRPIR